MSNRLVVSIISLILLCSPLAGCLDEEIQEEVVIPENQVPNAQIELSSYSAFTAQEFTIDGSESNDPDGQEIEFSWFVEGVLVSSGPTLTHSFLYPGEYTVTLQVSDGEETDTATTQVIASDKVGPECPAGDKELGIEPGGFDNFVRREGDRLYDGEYPFRFIGFNVPDLTMMDDHYPDGVELTGWHTPDVWEQKDLISSVSQMGSNVVRTYVISVGVYDAGPERHVTAPGELNEELFVALDNALATAREQCVRLIIPLVDQHPYWGGLANYARFSIPYEELHQQGMNWAEKQDYWNDSFWSDMDVREDFWITIKEVLNRVNTVTGVKYRDDPTILAWETGNELNVSEEWNEWTTDIAQRIKSEDPNHLIIDGRYGIVQAGLDDPNIDIVSDHYYKKNEDNANWPLDVCEDYGILHGYDGSECIEYENTGGENRKVFFVGEFGYANPEGMSEMMDYIIDNLGIAGAMIWQLKGHNSDGGFYWGDAGEIYNANGDEWPVRSYHWPGFDTGDDYHETTIVWMMREKAYEIRGMDSPALEPPDPPTILDWNYNPSFVWRGSAGATHYTLERSECQSDCEWIIASTDFHDSEFANTAEVTDEDVESGTYYYRMIAHNSGGDSATSNVVGPITPR